MEARKYIALPKREKKYRQPIPEGVDKWYLTKKTKELVELSKDPNCSHEDEEGYPGLRPTGKSNADGSPLCICKFCQREVMFFFIM